MPVAAPLRRHRDPRAPAGGAMWPRHVAGLGGVTWPRGERANGGSSGGGRAEGGGAILGEGARGLRAAGPLWGRVG